MPSNPADAAAAFNPLNSPEETMLSSTTVCICVSQIPQSVTGITTSFPTYREKSITAS